MKIPWKQLRSPQGEALLAVVLTWFVLLPGWYFLGNWYQANLIQQERAKAAEQIAARANALAAAVDQRIALLQGLYAFTRTEWPASDFDRPFEIYSSGVFFNTTGLRTLMIAPEGIARYIFPLYDAAMLSGYDILNDPDPAIREDVQRAILNRSITLGQPGELRQGGFGLIAWEAVYRGSDLWGLVSIAVDMNTVLRDSGLTNPDSGLDLALRDRLGYTFFGSGEVWQREPVIQSIALPEGAWDLGGAPQEGWAAAVRSQADVFRLSSLVIVSLTAVLVYLSVNRQGLLTQAVALRTCQIEAAQDALEERVQERTRELSALQKVSSHIGSTLDLDPLLGQILAEIKPVLDYRCACIYRLDKTGRLVPVNAAGKLLQAENESNFQWLDASPANQVIESLKPVIVEGWAAHDASPQTLCWMGIPLVIKDHAMGLLVFIHQDAQGYKDEDARLALTFAQQIAVAMENTRLYEQAGQLAVLEERQRLARELHDSVAQVLYSIGLGARTARAALKQNPAQIADALDYVNRLAEAGQVEMRALIFELRPESLRTDGLVAALEKQAAVLRTRHQIAVQADLCTEPDIALDIKETLYRISQEAFHNIVKHARASQVTLTLSCSESQVCLEIADDGVGFDPRADHPGHLGLQSMRERAVQRLGSLQIESAPGSGTKLRFIVPLQPG